MSDSTALQKMSLEELERLLLEKRLFLNRLEAVACNLPVRIETRSAEIQQLVEQMEQLRQQNMLDATNLEKTIRGVATVKKLLDLTEVEVQLRKNLISDLVELSPSEWNELDKLGSIFGVDSVSTSSQSPIATSVDVVAKPTSTKPAKANSAAFESKDNISMTPASTKKTNMPPVKDATTTDTTTTNSHSISPLLPIGNPILPSSKPVHWTVAMFEDFQISKSIASRWHITKSSHVLKPLLAGYHNGRIARDFTIELPHLESCAPNTLDCVACNRRIDADLRVRLTEHCEDCSFHPQCAAVHLDFCATNVDILHDNDQDGLAKTCIGRVFGKCPNSKKSDVTTTSVPPAATMVSKRPYLKTPVGSAIRGNNKKDQTERKRTKEM